MVGVEVRGGFVGEEKRWLVRERACDRHALALTGGESVRREVEPPLQPDIGQRC
jgi:hypothetical protein